MYKLEMSSDGDWIQVRAQTQTCLKPLGSEAIKQTYPELGLAFILRWNFTKVGRTNYSFGSQAGQGNCTNLTDQADQEREAEWSVLGDLVTKLDEIRPKEKTPEQIEEEVTGEGKNGK